MNPILERQLWLLCPRIDELLSQKETVQIAIDGFCAAGKTTLAAALQQRYDCNLFHMDDFFLRPQQRTPSRLAQAGGNVDYERFFQEVLAPLKSGVSFSYRPFSCKTMDLEAPVAVTPKALTIVEGTYSHHPYFLGGCDLKVFVSVSPETQAKRILERPRHLHESFFQLWIPMENAYFSAFEIQKNSDLVLAAEWD